MHAKTQKQKTKDSNFPMRKFAKKLCLGFIGWGRSFGGFDSFGSQFNSSDNWLSLCLNLSWGFSGNWFSLDNSWSSWFSLDNSWGLSLWGSWGLGGVGDLGLVDDWGGGVVDWGLVVDRGGVVDWGSLHNWDHWGSDLNDWGGGVGWGWGSLVGWGGVVLWVLGLSLVCHISNISVLGGSVGDDLGSAVGKSDLVSSSGVVSVALLVGVEVAEAVVVLDGVLVLVDGGLVRVGGLGVGWGGGTVGRDS